MDYTPHIAPNGILKWYEKDSFDIDWTINLTRDDEPLVFAPDDVVLITFYDCNDREVYTFSFTNIGSDNTIVLEMTPEISKNFAAGKYTYCMKYVDSTHNNYITTIAANKRVEVSLCH